MPKLSREERNALPDESFGLPAKRSYPLPNPSHARDAKARAAEEFNRGALSPAEKAAIDQKADAMLHGAG